MSDKRKCVNCRHRMLTENRTSSFCGLDGHFLHYEDVFEHWCKHWAKQKRDGNEAKVLWLDDIAVCEMDYPKTSLVTLA